MQQRNKSEMKLQELKMDVHLSVQDYRKLNEVVEDNTDETIRRKLVSKYNNYYRLWQDFNLLVGLFAMISLILAIVEWETNFENRGAYGD